MTCEDTRSLLSLSRSSRIALTEWAMVEMHLRECAGCRQEEARLRQANESALLAPSSDAALGAIRRTVEFIRTNLSHSAILARRGRSFLTAVSRAAPGTTGRLMQAATLSIRGWADRVPRPRALPPPGLGSLAQVLIRRFAGERPDDPPPGPDRAGRLPSAPPHQPGDFARRSPRAWIPPVPREAARASGPTLARPGAGHIVGRLSVKNLGTAERDLSTLLGEVEAIELARMRRPRLTTLQVIVPHGHYREFTHGLTRIGFWRLETASFSLPDAVHVTIRVTE